MQELNILNKRLDDALKEYGLRGVKYAQSEHDYRVALQKKILIEKQNGTQATLMSDICRGDPTIAALKFERDKAEVLYKSAGEALTLPTPKGGGFLVQRPSLA